MEGLGSPFTEAEGRDTGEQQSLALCDSEELWHVVLMHISRVWMTKLRGRHGGVASSSFLVHQPHTLPFKSLGSSRQFRVFHENSLLFIK